MQGLMQQVELTVNVFLDHAARWHPTQEVVSRRAGGVVTRLNYAQLLSRAKQVSNLLHSFGIQPGDRVATLAWNSASHMEIWYGAMGIGAVCHTLNPRLFPDQLAYIINDADDRIIFADGTFAPLLAQLLKVAPRVEQLILLEPCAEFSAVLPNALGYEESIASHSTDCRWGQFDENTACGLCYTSGTTGNPKGVLYSHRSNYLHTQLTLQADAFGLSARDVVMPIVPMFHANAWGLVFSAPAVGAKLVMPGSQLDGSSVLDLIEGEGVTFSAAVPTVWQGLLTHLRQSGHKPTTLRRVVIGGSACPEAMIRAFHEEFGVEVLHAWGMTELSPLGTVGSPTASISRLDFDQQLPTRVKQGRPLVGIDLEIVDGNADAVPHDGQTPGRLMVRGGTVAASYFGDLSPILTPESFFDTGDIATIDSAGFMQVTDRAKDIIKSGGEWIPSALIENIVASFPEVGAASVIGVPHAKWGERPRLIVQLIPGSVASELDLLGRLEGKIAKWWIPDAVDFVEQLPLTSTGKVDKRALRASYSGAAA